MSTKFIKGHRKTLTIFLVISICIFISVYVINVFFSSDPKNKSQDYFSVDQSPQTSSGTLKSVEFKANSPKTDVQPLQKGGQTVAGGMAFPSPSHPVPAGLPKDVRDTLKTINDINAVNNINRQLQKSENQESKQ